MFKILKKEDELETTNSDKRGNGLETADSVEQFDSEEQWKRRQYQNNKVAGKGRTSRQDD